MFILIIWLQASTCRCTLQLRVHALWAGIAMLPLTVGFLAAGPVPGGCRTASAPAVRHRGMLLAAVSFGMLEMLPVNFTYWQFRRDLATQRHRHGPVSPRRTARAS